MKHCPYSPGFTLRRISSDGKKLEVLATRCKSWGCPYCAQVNAAKLSWAIAQNIERANAQGGYAEMVFTTLTADAKSRTPDMSYKRLKAAWPVIKKWTERRYGKFSYVFIYELHATGVFHCHVVMLWRKTPQYKYYKRGVDSFARRLTRDYKDNARRWHIGYILKVETITDGVLGVVKYISKQLRSYLGKGGAKTWHALPSKARLYMVSRDFASIYAGLDDAGFIFSPPLHVSTVIQLPVIDLATGRALTLDDFWDSDYWPNTATAAAEAEGKD
jgi:hypothetical protein